MKKFLGKLDLLTLILAVVIIFGINFFVPDVNWTLVIACWVLYLMCKDK